MRRTITTGDPMHNRTSGNRAIPKLVIAGLVLLVLLLGGYTAYWFTVAAQLKAGVEDWAAYQRAQGNQVQFVWDGIEGFPFAFKARFQQPQLLLKGPAGAFDWSSGFLGAEMPPWDLQTVSFSSPAQQVARLRRDGQAGEWRLIAAAGIDGTLSYAANGALRELQMTLRMPDVTRPDGAALAAGEAGFRVLMPDVAPRDYTEPFATIEGEVTKLLLPDGTRVVTADPVEKLAFNAVINGPISVPVDYGMAPPLTEILAGWRDRGGDIVVKSFTFAQGPLTMGGEATLALDPDLQPLGAGTVTATGLSETVEILLHDGLIPAERAQLARSTAQALERLGESGKKEAKFALSLQNRVVSFGPVPLFTLAPIDWQ
jgi:hypothetical protein